MTQTISTTSTASDWFDPLARYARLDAELRQTLTDLERRISTLPGHGNVPQADTDIEETDDSYLIDMEIPGVKKDDVDVSINGRRMTISWVRHEPERKRVLRVHTRKPGRYSVQITLPERVDADAVEATLADGVLSLKVPKLEACVSRQITVNQAATASGGLS